MSERTAGFWGKIRIDDGQLRHWLSLSQHSLDVAAVFAALAALPAFRRGLEAGAGSALDDRQIQRLAVIALLHDVGKANLGFQDKVFDPKAPRVGHVRELAPLLFEADLQESLIVALDAETLCNWFETPDAAPAFLIAAWSHHGRPVVFEPAVQTGRSRMAQYWRADEGRNPFAAIAELLQIARQAFPLAFESGGRPMPATTALQHRFAGLVMLADWLGSHPSFFPLDRPAPYPFDRLREDARHAIRAVGLDVLAWQALLAERPAGFAERFGFDPRPLQGALDALPTDSADTRLLIAEAETGSGKTEAALARFFRLFAAREVDSLYFALPTRVAARELYGRVEKYVRRIFPEGVDRPPVLLAVPGYARVDNLPVERLLPGEETRCQDDDELARRERLWAAEHPKRFLAAPIAVGTIDQALLSALQTPHAHLRSVCLDRSLLVVDEVHASDPYMRRLLHVLLDHHLGLGGHALLLSATLGSRARAAFTGHDEPGLEEAVNAPYPALTDRSGRPHGFSDGEAEGQSRGKQARVELLPWLDQPESLLPEIARSLEAGARVLVVLNTVGRAIALQKAAEMYPGIEPTLFRCGEVIAPHHGRYAPVDREVLDAAVSAALGKDSPGGAKLLIGTQTLEQSLDIDADLLITDLCPMDVLLQRIGRLHRHRRERPSGFATARCLVLTPADTDLGNLLDARGEAVGPAKKQGLGSVYADLRVLQLTRDIFAERPEIEIPADNRRLVEGATHSERLGSLTGPRWQKHAEQFEGAGLAQAIRADYASLAQLYPLSFGDQGCMFRENEEVLTRLGLKNLRVPLDRELRSPFGQKLTEMVISAHLSPKSSTDETAVVAACEADAVILDYGGYRYRYSRHGLEKLDE